MRVYRANKDYSVFEEITNNDYGEDDDILLYYKEARHDNNSLQLKHKHRIEYIRVRHNKIRELHRKGRYKNANEEDSCGMYYDRRSRRDDWKEPFYDPAKNERR